MKHLLLTTIAAVLVVGCGESPKEISIHDAAVAGDIEAVKQHLAAGADVNAKTDDGWTPLQFAAMTGHKEIAELLIAKGADVNGKIEIAVDKGDTPLDWAIFNNHTEAIDLLRKHGDKTAEELKAEGKLEQANNRDRSD
jgi:ankyrin repeat protein